MVLTDILAVKRQTVTARKIQRPLAGFRQQLQPSRRDFHAALAAKRSGFILECKQASPSKGLLRRNFNPESIARTYTPFADAISVLTDEPFFRGSLEHLQVVSQTVDLPILCKDFIIDPYQVFEARYYGADAILLMLSVVDDKLYNRCAAVAESLEMDVLTEVHTEDELARAVQLSANIIGINNRNLATLQVDMSVTVKLAPQVPRNCLLVCESGIDSHSQVRRLAHQVDAFLVGSALMLEPELRHATTTLINGRVKVCGLTRVHDAQVVYRHGATHGGLIFARQSPRQVSLSQANDLVNVVDLNWVGVFANDELETVARYADELCLTAVQLHGIENDEYIQQLRGQLRPDIEIWQALPVSKALPELRSKAVDRILFDTIDNGRHGGTGKSFDWNLLHNNPYRAELILSGGIGPQNVAQANALDCWGLDVNSGLEDKPGIKSTEKITALFEQLRGAGRTTNTREAVA